VISDLEAKEVMKGLERLAIVRGDPDAPPDASVEIRSLLNS